MTIIEDTRNQLIQMYYEHHGRFDCGMLEGYNLGIETKSKQILKWLKEIIEGHEDDECYLIVKIKDYIKRKGEINEY